MSRFLSGAKTLGENRGWRLAGPADYGETVLTVTS